MRMLLRFSRVHACGLFFVVALIILVSHAWAIGTREAGKQSNQVLDTSVAIRNDEPVATWEIALPNDTDYWVSITCGDAQYDYGPHRVLLEGTEIINQVTGSNEFVTDLNRPVHLADGFLTVQIGGGNLTECPHRPYTLINSIVITNTDPGTQTFTPVKISFGPASPTPEPEYEQDIGEIKGDRGNGFNYGWTVSCTGRVYYRGDYGHGVALDSLIAADPSQTLQWDLDVPNGMYYVSLNAGDPQYRRMAQRVLVEDITLVSDLYVPQGQFATVNGWIINVFDGNLTLKIGGASDYTVINTIEVTDVKPANQYPFQVNFQPGYSPFVPGYIFDGGFKYNADRGFGFDIVRPIAERGINPNRLYDTDLTALKDEPRTWRLDCDNGDYYVYASLGDALYGFAYERLQVEGSVPLIDGTSTPLWDQPTAANTFLEAASHHVTVSDGHLDLVLGGGSSPSALNWVIVDTTPRTDWTFPVSINFQPLLAPQYDSWNIDDGSLYSPVTMHGWDIAAPVADREINADQRYDTVVAVFKSTTRTWEILVPNGTYYLNLCVGDPQYGFSGHRVRCVDSDTVIVNNVPLAANEFYKVTDHQVTVVDRKLTLEVGSTVSATTLNYVQIGTTPFGTNPYPN